MVEVDCILTAETAELIFNKCSDLSTLLILHAGSFTVVASEAYKKTMTSSLSRAYHSGTSVMEKEKAE